MAKGINQIEIVESFLTFASANLDDPVERDRGLIMALLSGGLDIPSLVRATRVAPNLYSPISDGDRKRLKDLQTETRHCLEWLVDNLSENRYLVFDVPSVFVWHTTFAYGIDRGADQPIRAALYNYQGAMRQNPIELFEFPVYFREFLEALDGFEKSALSRCPECKKIFFNPTRRKKTYCSPRCQNTAGVRRLREKKAHAE